MREVVREGGGGREANTSRVKPKSRVTRCCMHCSPK